MDRTGLKKIVEKLVGLEEMTVSQDIDIVDDRNEEWIDHRFKPDIAILRIRLDESACLGMAERNDVGPKEDQCHYSRCRP